MSSNQLINSKYLQRFPEPSMSQSCSVQTTTIMGKTADLTVDQKTLIDTLHEEGKPQKVIAERADCSQRVLYQSIFNENHNGKLTGREKCVKKRCTSNRDDRSLERIVKQS